MNYGEIKWRDVANGTGVRVSLFVSGCRNKCPGCFNEATWDFNYGSPFTSEIEDKIIEALKPDYIEGLTILGGEPFEPENQEALYPFIKKVREIYPNKTIWMYSGYVLDKEIYPIEGKVHTKYSHDIINLIDILVDGRYVCTLRDLMLNFRGSKNQRIIDINQSKKENKIVLSKLNN